MKRKVKTYTISAVAELFDIHPQTLRLYEREGLLKPSRSKATRVFIGLGHRTFGSDFVSDARFGR